MHLHSKDVHPKAQSEIGRCLTVRPSPTSIPHTLTCGALTAMPWEEIDSNAWETWVRKMDRHWHVAFSFNKSKWLKKGIASDPAPYRAHNSPKNKGNYRWERKEADRLTNHVFPHMGHGVEFLLTDFTGEFLFCISMDDLDMFVKGPEFLEWFVTGNTLSRKTEITLLTGRGVQKARPACWQMTGVCWSWHKPESKTQAVLHAVPVRHQICVFYFPRGIIQRHFGSMKTMAKNKTRRNGKSH